MLKDMLISNAMLGNGGGGGGASALVVTEEEVGGVWQLDKTWQEINDAAPLVWFSSGGEFLPLQIVYEDSGDYSVKFFSSQYSEYLLYVASSANGYPAFVETGVCGLGIRTAYIEIDGSTGTLSLTWQEIFDANFVIVRAYGDMEIDVVTMYVSEALYDPEHSTYLVNVYNGSSSVQYSTNSPDGYPTVTFGGDVDDGGGGVPIDLPTA